MGIPVGFEITPFLDGSGDPDIVDLNPPPKVVPTLQVGALGSTFDPVNNPISKQGQATLFGAPIPILPPPPPRIVVVEPEPEPEPVVIGSRGTTLPDPPAPRKKFVIGAAANGAEVKRPLPRSRSAVGAAANSAPRSLNVASSRSQTVIGAAASNSRSDSRPARRPSTRRTGIVIGLRNNRRKRAYFF